MQELQKRSDETAIDHYKRLVAVLDQTREAVRAAKAAASIESNEEAERVIQARNKS